MYILINRNSEYNGKTVQNTNINQQIVQTAT